MKHIIGFDKGTGKDYSCKITAKKYKNGTIKVIKITRS